MSFLCCSNFCEYEVLVDYSGSEIVEYFRGAYEGNRVNLPNKRETFMHKVVRRWCLLIFCCFCLSSILFSVIYGSG
jgi:hypothetical protein